MKIELEKDIVIIKVWGDSNWYYSPSSKNIYHEEGFKIIQIKHKEAPKEVIETIKNIDMKTYESIQL